MSERTPLINSNDPNSLAHLLSRTYGDITTFDKLLKDLGTSRDTNSFRSNLYQKKVEISDNLKLISNKLKQPSSMSKIQKEKILKDLKDATNRFEELMQLASKKESASKPINDPEAIEQHRNSFREPQNFGGRNNINNGGGGYQNNNNNYNGGGGYNDFNQQQQQYQEQDQDKKFTFGLGGQLVDQEQIYNDIIEERNKATRQLVDDMRTLQDIVGDISQLVEEDGEKLVIANNNVETADTNVEAGVDDLEKALVYKTSYRKKVFFLVICLGITLAALIIFLGLWFGVFKKK
ncbi:putative syntaxin 7 [Heterostelium album PN500]|uniref:Putative syntaxin 7 n=1 Tax=Heterostelium pallidum (strain ATCC 26659 / Pp 5 / PN500) TaxID=670386 RepID=D3BCF0_HETP5|nr:putative syntaxin 7 [Heterostelium album PN500]EFA80940.1 putative syntaxin 7 [Heterostelium album PN500]|eukprot:XP_020433058.1 putative syntaxin 7 [Heterostelium album PN500]